MPCYTIVIDIHGFKGAMTGQKQTLRTIEVSTGDNPDASVIWLHGLGADGHDFEPIVQQLNLPSEIVIRFIFPHAPVLPVTLNGGMEMPAWYDLHGISADVREDEPGVRNSAAAIDELIAHEKSRGISADRIVLVGFSQGGAIALHAGLRQLQPLAGIIALSTYLPVRHALADEADIKLAPGSIFMAHGTQDPVVGYALGTQSRSLLEHHGYAIEWHDYPMEHTVCAEEILDIRNWMLKILTIPDIS